MDYCTKFSVLPCYNCNKKTTFICGKCKLLKYCSYYCQKKHWKLQHEFFCSPNTDSIDVKTFALDFFSKCDNGKIFPFVGVKLIKKSNVNGNTHFLLEEIEKNEEGSVLERILAQKEWVKVGINSAMQMLMMNKCDCFTCKESRINITFRLIKNL